MPKVSLSLLLPKEVQDAMEKRYTKKLTPNERKLIRQALRVFGGKSRLLQVVSHFRTN